MVFDRSSLTRWRQRMGEEKLQALLQESLSVATNTKAIKPSDLNRIIVDTPVQPRTPCSRPTRGFSTAPARSWCGRCSLAPCMVLLSFGSSALVEPKAEVAAAT
jgi:hypothetical protein